MLNRQAMLDGDLRWNDYGNVSLYEAARQEAIKASIDASRGGGMPNYTWFVLVRCEGDSRVPVSRVEVRTELVAEIVNPRQGAE